MAVGDYQPLGYEQSASGALKVPANAKHAAIQAETSDYRYRDDGVAPTTTVGMLLKAGAAMWYTGDLAKLAFIVVTSGNLNVSYYS